MITIPRILLTPGEPAGIGPDIMVQMAQEAWAAELICVANPGLLTARAKQLELPLTLLPFTTTGPVTQHQPHTLKIIPVPLAVPVTAGQLNAANAKYVLSTLEIATDYCLQQQANALVTGPVHKGILNTAGFAFSGHTEFLAARCQAAHPLMLFVVPQTKVALVTTHLPLAAVPAAITQEKLLTTLQILHAELIRKFQLDDPTILVCGLNPHAGEQGYLGREEIEIIAPALAAARAADINVIGPLPADTIFTHRQLATADAVLAMYHDQALSVVKYMSFGHAVNVTLGLPIIRTSVDHGTALDVAGTLQADAGSLHAAVKLAITLASSSMLDHRGAIL